MSFISRRDLSLAVTAKAISWFGDELAAISLVLRLQSHGSSAYAVAALLIASALPLVLLAGHAGRFSDRFDSRITLVAVASAQGLICVVLANAGGTAEVLALVAALGCGQAVTSATWQGLIATVAGDALPRAMAASQAAMTGAGILAPAAGGLLTGWYGARVPLLIDAVTYLAIAVAGLSMRTRRGSRATAASDPRGGLAIVAAEALLRRLIPSLGLFVLLGSMVNVTEVFLIRGTLHASATWYGIASASWAAGCLIGALAAPRLRGDRRLAQGFVASAAALTAALALFALAPSVSWVLVPSIAGGIGNGVMSVAVGALVMGRAAPEVRGRVGAVLTAVANGTQLTAYAVAGALAIVFTPREIFAIAGGLGALAPLLFGSSLIRAASAGPAVTAATG